MEQLNINHVLTEQESAALINILGQLPTSSGVYPLVVRLTQTHNEVVNAAKQPAAAEVSE